MNLNAVLQTVRRFLFSSVNRQFLTFLFFLILSGVFWLMMTLNETYEQELRLTVRVTGIPSRVVLTSPSSEVVRITVRDKGWVLANYLLTSRRGTLLFAFRSYDRHNGRGYISSADIRRAAEQYFESSTKVLSVKPDSLEFFYNNGESKRVPVRYTGRVIPEQLYFISHVEYMPDSVDVYASREKLDSISVVYTEPLNYASFRDSLLVECRLAHMRDVKVVPERIRIGFYTDVLAEETIDEVPIQCINLPEGKILRTFPAKAKVHFVTGVSQLRTLKPEDFVVVADYREVTQRPSDKCNLYLRSVPRGVSHATLDPKQVDYLIEEE